MVSEPVMAANSTAISMAELKRMMDQFLEKQNQMKHQLDQILFSRGIGGSDDRKSTLAVVTSPLPTRSEPKTMKNTEISHGNFVEHLVGDQNQKTTSEISSKVRKSWVKERSYHKARKRRIWSEDRGTPATHDSKAYARSPRLFLRVKANGMKRRFECERGSRKKNTAMAKCLATYGMRFGPHFSENSRNRFHRLQKQFGHETLSQEKKKGDKVQKKQVSVSFAFNGKFSSEFRPHDPFNPCSHDDLMIEEGEIDLMNSIRLTTAARHGTKEKQIIGLSTADKVLMPGRVSDFSLFNRVWKPGVILDTVLNNRLDCFEDYLFEKNGTGESQVVYGDKRRPIGNEEARNTVHQVLKLHSVLRPV